MLIETEALCRHGGQRQSRRRGTHALSIALLLGLSVGCLDRREHEVRKDNQCTACHGSDADGRLGLMAAAPPFDVDGNTSVSDRGVGAHQVHLNSDGRHAVVACNECHVVPEETYSRGHVDSSLPAEVRLGVLAVSGQGTARYDADALTCSDTYCHGNGEPPVWTSPRSAADACGSCHGLPPAAPHPQDSNCANCHGDVIDEEGEFVAPQLHVNGTVEVLANACNACHGTRPDGAPPPDLDGNVDTAIAGVGSHDRHLLAGDTHGAVACNECHVVPDSADAPGHMDSERPAEITFGDLASSSGASPAYDFEDKTCGNTYCHGSTLPVWTEPRSSADACGTCHGLPPAAPHPAQDDCSSCHGSVIAADGTINNPDLHINGEVDVGEMACNACHGTLANGAPPPDLSGSTDTASPGVGAHTRHLEAGLTHAAVSCESCHNVPAAVDAPGHLDDTAGAELEFSGLATLGGRPASYDAETKTCSSSYCHRSAQPVWTEERSSAEACGSCHALPPPAPHPANDDCSVCHGAVIASDGTFSAPERHVNGTVDVGNMPCNGCHGTSADGAPPPDLSGSSDSSSPGVGAHEAHLRAGPDHIALDCSTCHLVPTSVGAVGHMNDGSAGAEVIFGGLALAGASDPSYSSSTHTCSDTYCHGAQSQPWVAPRDSAAACGSCHGLPPAAPHPQNPNCATCHNDVIDASGNFENVALHINGAVNFGTVACNACHGSGSLGAPPPDLSGNVATSFPGVGAHQAHLVASETHEAVACNQCHLVPSSVGAAGHIDSTVGAEVVFGELAQTGNRTPSYDPATQSCADVYCHQDSQPDWTAPRSSAEACGSCHSLPPPSPHPQFDACSMCHGGVIDDTGVLLDPSSHVNGAVDN